MMKYTLSLLIMIISSMSFCDTTGTLLYHEYYSGKNYSAPGIKVDSGTSGSSAIITDGSYLLRRDDIRGINGITTSTQGTRGINISGSGFQPANEGITTVTLTNTSPITISKSSPNNATVGLSANQFLSTATVNTVSPLMNAKMGVPTGVTLQIADNAFLTSQTVTATGAATATPSLTGVVVNVPTGAGLTTPSLQQVTDVGRSSNQSLCLSGTSVTISGQLGVGVLCGDSLDYLAQSYTQMAVVGATGTVGTSKQKRGKGIYMAGGTGYYLSNGGAFLMLGGVGGIGGDGGVLDYEGGLGGDGTTTITAGNGGNVTVIAGGPGVNNGGGAGVQGNVNIQAYDIQFNPVHQSQFSGAINASGLSVGTATNGTIGLDSGNNFIKYTASAAQPANSGITTVTLTNTSPITILKSSPNNATIGLSPNQFLSTATVSTVSPLMNVKTGTPTGITLLIDPNAYLTTTSLIAGTGISVTPSDNTVTIDSTPAWPDGWSYSFPQLLSPGGGDISIGLQNSNSDIVNMTSSLDDLDNDIMKFDHPIQPDASASPASYISSDGTYGGTEDVTVVTGITPLIFSTLHFKDGLYVGRD